MSAILTRDQGRVRILTLNRPDVRNALSHDLRLALSQAMEEAREEPAVRCLVLTGAGTAFCAGLDLRELATLRTSTTEENRRDSRALADLLYGIYTSPLPVIAAVNGPAVGGGAGLASACDLVIASAEARLGYTEARLGFVAALVSTFLVRQVGDRAARDLLLSARLVAAEEARALGLVNEVVPPDQVLPRAIERAEQLADNAPTSLALTKSLLASLPGLALEDGLRFAVEVNALARTTSELAEGIQAFLEKRSPRWSSRS